jgi:hypothetical protein
MATPTIMLGPSNPTRFLESKARAQKQAEKEVDLEAKEHLAKGLKPHKVEVSVKGQIDGACKGKNNWDDTLRSIDLMCLMCLLCMLGIKTL